MHRIDRITEAFPHLAGEDVVLLGAGQFADAFVADETVFRFPRSEFGRSKLKREAVLLQSIAPDLPLRTSTPTLVALDGPLSGAFVAHRLIPGVVLRKELLVDSEAEVRDRIAYEVGEFLRRLHAIDLSKIPRGVPRLGGSEFVSRLRERVETELMPRLGPSGRKRAVHELDGVSRVMTPEAPVLCHTDLGGNVILDPPSGTVGVIDFGEAIVSDPVLDIASLSILGEDFVGRAANAYPLLSERLEDASAVRQTFALQDALGGASQGDWSYVDQVLTGYEREA